jgi:hypothetical protein
MTMKDCISAKAKGRIVNKNDAQKAIDEYDELFNSAKQTMGKADADAFAARGTVEKMSVDADRKIVNEARMHKKAQEIISEGEAYRTDPNDDGTETKWFRAFFAKLTRDRWDQYHGSNVVFRERQIRGFIHAIAEEAITPYRNRIGGFKRNPAGQKNILRELGGVKTGDESAAAAAQAFTKAALYALRRFNRAGGNIVERQNWMLPQRYDAVSVGKTTKKEFRDLIWEHLDRNLTGFDKFGRKLTDEELIKFIDDAHDSIRSNGLIGAEPSFVAKNGAMANRRMEHRHLVYKNPESWLEVQARFGKGSIFEVMQDHMDGMAKEISLMEILGPNPAAMVAFMASKIRVEGEIIGRKNKASKEAQRLQGIYDEIIGRNHIPFDSTLAQGWAALRNVLTGFQLGGATQTAVAGDLATMRIASRFNGLDTTKVIARTIRLLDPKVNADKRIAIRTGLIAEGWSAMSIGQQRYTGEIIGPKFSQMISDFTLTASGLNAWTQASRWAFGAEFMGALADQVGKKFDQIPEPLREALQRYGVQESDWARITTNELHRETVRGLTDTGDFLSVKNIADNLDEGLASKIHEMVLTETEFAVPTVTPEITQLMRGGTRPGTVGGVLMGSTAMYKSFSVAVTQTHIMRGLNLHNKGVGGKARYLASLAISTTLMGALALQSKNITKGRDPQNMFSDDPLEIVKFWTAAMIQGGGIGIFGDFLFSDVSRAGRYPLVQFAGPGVGFINDFASLTKGNFDQLIGGDEANALREAIHFTERNNPFSSLWYARLAMERVLWDNLDEWADPAAARRTQRAQVRRLRSDTGQEQWWRTGRTLPQRGPELGAALGE